MEYLVIVTDRNLQTVVYRIKSLLNREDGTLMEEVSSKLEDMWYDFSRDTVEIYEEDLIEELE